MAVTPPKIPCGIAPDPPHDVLSDRTDLSAGPRNPGAGWLENRAADLTREDMWWWILGVRPSPASTS